MLLQVLGQGAAISGMDQWCAERPFADFLCQALLECAQGMPEYAADLRAASDRLAASVCPRSRTCTRTPAQWLKTLAAADVALAADALQCMYNTGRALDDSDVHVVHRVLEWVRSLLPA